MRIDEAGKAEFVPPSLIKPDPLFRRLLDGLFNGFGFIVVS
jgi:hypothetical protein